jgi:hypothetical protein
MGAASPGVAAAVNAEEVARALRGKKIPDTPPLSGLPRFIF